jgi:hypothetical protein
MSEIGPWLVRLAIVVFVGSTAHRAGDAYLVAGKSEQLQEMQDGIRGAREEISWYRDLRSKLEISERRAAALEALEKEMVPHLLAGEADRLRMTIARDETLSELPEVTLIPSGGMAAPERLVFHPVEDLSAELEGIKQRFQKGHPNERFQEWGGPRPIEVLRYIESYRIEATYDASLEYLAKIETAPTWMEVTDLIAEGLESPGGEKLLRMDLTLSGLSLPRESNPEAGVGNSGRVTW